MKQLLLTCSLIAIGSFGWAQCTIIPNAVPNLTLAYSVGVNNATGVAYNPNLNLWYIAQAGNAGFALETFDASGTPLYQTNTGFDMRGLWWNNNTNQLESNGYNIGGIWAYNLDVNGYALNTGTSIFTGMNQPTVQSVGDYNCVDNEIWYYNAGSIMKRDRATNALIGNFPLVGLPVGTGNLNDNSIFYTDCAGHEIGLYDYVLRRAYFFDKTTLTYTGFSQLPAGSINPNSFRASWANGLLWLFDTGPDIWYSYEVLTGFNSNCTVIACTPPSLITDDLTTCAPNTVDLNSGINAASAPGNGTFHNTLADADAAVNPIAPTVTTSGWYYVRYEDPSDPTCYSVDSILVTINPVYNTNESFNVCENTSYTYPDGFNETITGNTSHVSNLTTIAGCDSIVTTSITMDPIYNLSESFNVCENSSYTYPDGFTETITANTTHISNLATVAGCDSIITTTITMDPVYSSTVNESVCENTSYTYPDGFSEVITANATHVSNLSTIAGCDSVITTNITMVTNYSITENLNICENTNYIYPDGFSEVITANTSHISNLFSVAGCDSIITTNITMDPLLDAGINGAISFCTNSSSSDLFAELGGTPDVGGSWSPALASGTGMFNPSVDAGGTYTYTVTGPCGSVSADVVVTVSTIPDPGTNGSITFCSNDPTTNLFNSLGGSPDPGGTWSPMPASGSGNFNPSVDPSGVYTYTISTSCGTFSSQVNVTVNPAQNANFSYPSGVYCISASDPTPTITGTAGGTFSASGNGVVNPSTGVIDISASGVGGFSVTYTTPGPCADTYVFDVSILNEANATITAVDPMCENENTIMLQAAPGGTWSGPGVDPQTGEFDPSLANIGSNTITYTIGGACGDVQSITIDVIAIPTVTTINDTLIEWGETIELTTTGTAPNYTWYPSQWLDCDDCQNPLATPEETIIYTVSNSENGCTSYASVLVTVHVVPSIFVPNIFSPNGDNHNDVLYVRGRGIRELNFIVYDRWGEKVFQSTDQDLGWDGTFRGKKMNPAVFVYYVEATFVDGESTVIKGDVTLIR